MLNAQSSSPNKNEDPLWAQVTPVILTFNEELNISRCLTKLTWARRVVVVDSFSTDSTVAICESYPNVDIFRRKFDSHAAQWNFAIRETGIETEWILALDADYIIPDAFPSSVERAISAEDLDGFQCRFRYIVGGRPLRASLYPPVTVLFRRGRATYVQDGHTQRVMIAGKTSDLDATIDHDDRKPLSRWFSSQAKYAALEAAHLLHVSHTQLGLVDRIRLFGWLAPILVGVYVLFVRGSVWDGRAGIYYAFQRILAEILLALELIDHRLRNATKS